MNINDIKKVINLVENANISNFEYEEENCKIKIEKKLSFSNETFVQAITPIKETVEVKDLESNVIDFNNIKEFKSPMVGVFYTSPKPGAKPFVSKGDKVKKGDVLCIIEAMKIINEIVSDVDGDILEICVNNGDLVEYAQTLFKII